MKDTRCVVPWLHLNILPGGRVLHCGMNAEPDFLVGNLSTDTVNTIWNSRNLRELRVAMLEGQQPAPCAKCFDSEKASGESLRLDQNRYFPNKLAEIRDITRPDGAVARVDLQYWDFRFSNLCNFKCRTCGPEYSSAWLPEARELGLFDAEDKAKILKIETVNTLPKLDFLEEHVATVKKVYFAGGEPLLMDEHWFILDLLDRHARHDVAIAYNTNLSTLRHKGKDALAYWEKWGPNLCIGPSIDEIDERAELVRSGTHWKTVEANLRLISDIGIHVRPNITVSVMNAHRLPQILTRLVELGVVSAQWQWQNFTINLVGDLAFHVSMYPDHFKQEIRRTLARFVNDFDAAHGCAIGNKFNTLLEAMSRPRQAQGLKNFKYFNERLDEMRGEKILEVIPELACLWDAPGH